MKRFFVLAVLLSSVFILAASCASLRSKSSGSGPATDIQSPPAPEVSNTYYDFDDILVPKEMKILPDDSLIVESSQFKGGLLCFGGDVDPISLFNFFVSSMSTDGWKLRNYFKYGRYMLIFEKPNKDCVIRISKKRWNTWLEIWVTPKPAGQGGS
jgi:hypothetical protein